MKRRPIGLSSMANLSMSLRALDFSSADAPLINRGYSWISLEMSRFILFLILGLQHCHVLYAAVRLSGDKIKTCRKFEKAHRVARNLPYLSLADFRDVSDFQVGSSLEAI